LPVLRQLPFSSGLRGNQLHFQEQLSLFPIYLSFAGCASDAVERSIGTKNRKSIFIAQVGLMNKSNLLYSLSTSPKLVILSLPVIAWMVCTAQQRNETGIVGRILCRFAGAPQKIRG
jgi:hypothetical protein